MDSVTSEAVQRGFCIAVQLWCGMYDGRNMQQHFWKVPFSPLRLLQREHYSSLALAPPQALSLFLRL